MQADVVLEGADEVLSIVSLDVARSRVEGAILQCLQGFVDENEENFCGKVQLLGRDLIQSPKLFMRALQVLSFVHGLLIQDRMSSQRDVYYQLITFFSSVEECYRDIEFVARSLRLSRISLNIYAASRGFVVGQLEVSKTKKICHFVPKLYFCV
jgi:DNA topoisomerase VI subunit A